MQSNQIKPWHIILFTVAILLVLWQAFGYVREKRRQSSATYQAGPGPNITPYTPPHAQRILERMEREK
ncbi:MAG: hypothetical protein HPY54_12065 [Chthonomonadetes bacterium]|nr:hypothetical protein [Chthonomonadetes bacterium]